MKAVCWVVRWVVRLSIPNNSEVLTRLKISVIGRAHFSKKCILKVGKAFCSRICHAVVFTQFGYADFKSFSDLKFKNKMAGKICKNVTTVHHGSAHNEHKNIISVS